MTWTMDTGKHSSANVAIRGVSIEQAQYGKPSPADVLSLVADVQAARIAPAFRMTDGTMCKSCDGPVDVLTGLCRCSQ